ncbi:MAG TPA: DNA polymerase III subunit gamma/tau [Microthrixaceae bacterium]|jgi:DNA polymerase-3 subunit gamma/tau|nr:DNA polymerase III subunit gamma/tau [Microthrixaceae bacterium]HQF94081.1 DNA polymerase III subunit gamma/tau [Microthrixaceae bacterium]
MAHQSLYRRYRPRRFADVRGQDHVVKALRNAVAQGTEGHAYLFSGPRGTGKTSTARILAKALNCPNLVDGEPCGECESCLSIEHGNSYDLFELDAASNNGVDAMRELISRTVVGSPGRNKVYILDEVHMLSPAASNALLKTLEEPPEHVCFVLATTDPQKVLPTIRSRTQHFEFSLLSATELADYVRWIREDAGLTFDDAAVDHVVRQGRGSARDTLSALDMVVAAGGVTDRAESVEEIMTALVDRDTARVMIAVSDAVAQGREPRVLAEQLLVSLRDAFLASVHAHLEHLSDSDQAQMADLAGRLGTATITRALESLGLAIVDMRQAADPRVPLEVALIRLTTPSADTSVQALVERIDDLERRLARGIPAGAAPAAPAPATSPGSDTPAPATPVVEPHPEPAPTSGAASSPAEIRAQLAARKGDAPSAPTRPSPPKPPTRPGAPSRPGSADPSPSAPAATPAPAPAPSSAAPPAPVALVSEPSAPTTAPAPAPAAGGGTVTLEQLAAAMTESVLPTLSGMTKSLYGGGRFVGEADGKFQFALDNVPDRVLPRAQAALADVEAALSVRVGQPVSVHLTNGGEGSSSAPSSSGTPAPTPVVAADTDQDERDHIDVSDLEDATDVSTSGVDKLVQAFPGAELIEQETP